MLQSLQSEGSILAFRHFLLLLSTSGQEKFGSRKIVMSSQENFSLLLCRVKKNLGQAKPFEDAKGEKKRKKGQMGFTNHSLPLLIFRGEVMVNSLGTLLNIGQLANRREAQHDQCSRAAVSTVSSSGRSCTHAQPSWSRLWSQLTTTV